MCIIEMHYLEKYLHPPSMKGKSYEAANWKVRDQEFTVSEIRVAIKGRPPSYMQYELDGHQEDYRSLTHEDWCDLLSIIKVEDNRKSTETQINNIVSSKAASLSDSD